MAYGGLQLPQGTQTGYQGLGKDKYIPPQTTMGKVGGFVGGMAKAIVSPVATMAARPIQLAAELGGASAEQVNAVSARVPFGLVAPVPQSGADVMKDVGRGIQTAAFALPTSTIGKLALGGGTFGLGASMEQGNPILSKETAMNIGAGAALGGTLGVIGKGLASRALMSKTAEQYATEAAARAKFGPIPEIGAAPVPPPLVDSAGKYDLRTLMTQRLPALGYDNAQIGHIMKDLHVTNDSGHWTPAEVDTATAKVIPSGEPIATKPVTSFEAMIKERGATPSPETSPVTGPIEKAVNVKNGIPTTETPTMGTTGSPAAPREYIPSTDAEKIAVVRTGGIDNALNVLRDPSLADKGVPLTAYRAVAGQMAQEEALKGNMGPMSRFLDTPFVEDIKSVAGQELQATKLAEKGNAADILANAKQMLKDNLPKRIQDRSITEVRKYGEQIKKIMDNLPKTVTKEDVSKIINDLIC